MYRTGDVKPTSCLFKRFLSTTIPKPIISPITTTVITDRIERSIDRGLKNGGGS